MPTLQRYVYTEALFFVIFFALFVFGLVFCDSRSDDYSIVDYIGIFGLVGTGITTFLLIVSGLIWIWSA